MAKTGYEDLSHRAKTGVLGRSCERGLQASSVGTDLAILETIFSEVIVRARIPNPQNPTVMENTLKMETHET